MNAAQWRKVLVGQWQFDTGHVVKHLVLEAHALLRESERNDHAADHDGLKLMSIAVKMQVSLWRLLTVLGLSAEQLEIVVLENLKK